MGGTGRPLGKTFFLQCQRRHPELPKIPTYLRTYLPTYLPTYLTLAQNSPKLTPRLDPPEVGTRQLTLCPCSTNFLEPSPNLVRSEVLASVHHGFVKWGHDAKITQIGIILTRGSPGQGEANRSQDTRQDLGPISRCTTWNYVRVLMGIEIWGRQLTTRGG